MNEVEPKLISSAFEIHINTVTKWLSNPSRKSHIQYLSLALDAVSQRPFYAALLSCDMDVNAIADRLALDNFLSSEIDGISSRTLRSWILNPQKKKLIVGILIGFHWFELAKLAEESNNSLEELISILDLRSVSLVEAVKMYKASSQLVQLL